MIIRRLSVGLAIAMLIVAAGARGRPLHGYTAIPRGQVFMLELLSPIHSDRNKKGDEFTCKVIAPEDYAGAIVTGHIGAIKASGKAGKKSEIALAFNSIAMAERSDKFDAQVTEVYDVDAGHQGQADEEGRVKG